MPSGHWRGEPKRPWESWIEIFQPLSPAPSFAQRRSQTWDACTCTCANIVPTTSEIPCKLRQNLLRLSPLAVLTWGRVTCEDLRGALCRSGAGEGRLCDFEASSRLRVVPSHPRPWLHGQRLPLTCLSDRAICIAILDNNPWPWLFPQRPLTLGASRAQGRGMVGGLCGWRGGGPEWPCKFVQHPSSTNVSSIMNCIGSSSYLSSHLPRRSWALMVEKRSYTHRLLPERFNS